MVEKSPGMSVLTQFLALLGRCVSGSVYEHSHVFVASKNASLLAKCMAVDCAGSSKP